MKFRLTTKRIMIKTHHLNRICSNGRYSSFCKKTFDFSNDPSLESSNSHSCNLHLIWFGIFFLSVTYNLKKKYSLGFYSRNFLCFSSLIFLGIQISLFTAHIWETAEQKSEEKIQYNQTSDQYNDQKVWNTKRTLSNEKTIPHGFDPFSAKHSKYDQKAVTYKYN